MLEVAGGVLREFGGVLASAMPVVIQLGREGKEDDNGTRRRRPTEL